MPCFDIEIQYRVAKGNLSSARRSREITANLISRRGRFDEWFQWPARPDHAFQVVGSESILMKIPPTTERAWKATWVPSRVQ